VTDDFAPGTRWNIDLSPYDAIILFDWLMTVDFDQIPVEHKAQKQALADLLTVLETQAPSPTSPRPRSTRPSTRYPRTWTGRPRR
jgi:hypothetical protein